MRAVDPNRLAADLTAAAAAVHAGDLAFVMRQYDPWADDDGAVEGLRATPQAADVPCAAGMRLPSGRRPSTHSKGS